MQKQTSARRNFIKHSIGLGGLALNPLNHFKTSEIFNKVKNDSTKLHVICIGAHPGDPEFGCGGTMAKYSAAGHKVTFLYITRGDASDPKIAYAEMAARRTKEAEAACGILNSVPKFFGQIDGDTVLSQTQNAAMQKFIETEQPDIVFTQWPLDGHPDHQVTGLLALTAWVRAARKFHLYFYEVNTGSETMAFTPTDYVDISEVHDKKKAAMFAHKTQNPVETYNDYFKPLEEFRGLECGVKVAEAFIHFKPGTQRARLMEL